MNLPHTSAPIKVPAGFAKASSSYRLRVWVAMVGLILFLLLYVGLASWFTYTAYRMIAGVLAGGEGSGLAFLVSVPATFLAIFMWKALFFVRHGSDDPGVEVTAEDQPELFGFLYDLADELGAPRPHRVFLSPNVNACVFYDLSILNFLLPSKKNLIIGLGLVNVLNRSEFKAVLAHEFGHFAQRSMALGRWVYVGEQIAGHIIAKRDALDRMLDFISHIDIRIAWIGWIMRTIVWSIRSLMETAFRWVVVAHRALSREMEFQADRVAVSATGSDALIQALYRLQFADEDWELSLNFANTQLGKERKVLDLFAVQTRIGEQMRRVLNDPMRGSVAEDSSEDPARRRLFTEQIAQPPRMWSTHPPNTEREENAKRIYIASPLETESAWTLFETPQELRETVTQLLFAGIHFEKDPEALSTGEALAAVDEQFSHESYRTQYRGTYLGRRVAIGIPRAPQMYGNPPATENLAASLQELYPESLHDSLTQWRNLEEEIALLEAIHDGYADASGGVIRHRGKVIPRRELPELIDRVKQERDAALASIEEHDRTCRTVHDAAAQQIAHGWRDYLQSLTRLLHYVEHSEADLADAQGHLANTTMMATATGRVSSEKLNRVLSSANDLQQVMARLDQQATKIQLPEPILKELEAKSWRDALDKFELPPADQYNISQWMEVVDSWVLPMLHRFSTLRKATLAELLRTEQKVAAIYLQHEESQPAPQPAAIPGNYPSRPRGTERERQKKLDWWSRFTLADGTGPGLMRLVVATTIVAAVVIAGMSVGKANVVVYNGLSIPVNVQIHRKNITVSPYQHRTVSVDLRSHCRVLAEAPDGRRIEDFEVSLDRGFANYVYNVAGAAPLVEWTAVYGSRTPREPKMLGFPRWRTTSAEHIFTEPPRQIETSGTGGIRRVLSSNAQLPPQYTLATVSDPVAQEQVIRTHAKWDSPNGKHIYDWLMRASRLKDFDEILSHRLQADPAEVVTLRIQQDTAEPAIKPQILARHRDLARQHPDDAGWQYIAIRAMPDGPEQDQAFVEALKKWPEYPWLSNAVAYHYSTQGEWDKALTHYKLPLGVPGPWYDSAAIQVARIRRLLALKKQQERDELAQILGSMTHNASANLQDLRDSAALMQHLALETGDGFEDTRYSAYALMNQGQLEKAYQAAGGSETDPQLLVLLAATPGAKPEWQEQVLSASLDDFENYDPTLLLYVAALAHRHGKPYQDYIEKFAARYPQEQLLLLDLLRKFLAQGRPPESFEEQDLKGLDPRSRGLVFATTLVLFPDRVQESWRKSANALLFAAERPAF